MSDEKNKKGFGGLSSLESQVDPIKSDEIPKVRKAETAEASPRNSPSSSAPPQVSVVVPSKPTPPIFIFIRQYWLLIGIALFIAYASLTENSPSHSTLTETLPNYGTGQTLSSSEIYYCLAEAVRIDANRTTMNTYDDFSVNRFNRSIDDYNGRCSSYRYKQSAMGSATKALNENRYSIEAQGRSRM